MCACKDFAFPTMRLFEFGGIKNPLSDEDECFSSAPSDGKSTYPNDVLAAIEAPSCLARFRA